MSRPFCLFLASYVLLPICPFPAAGKHVRLSVCSVAVLLHSRRLLPFLPDPIPLADVLTDLRKNLTAFPHAMLGKVGLDRACRIPFSHPADPPFAAAADNAPSSARELSPFTIPLAHQLAVLEAQLAVAAALARPVSLHSVKAQQATRELLDRMRAAHGARWLAISVDLHSCGLSAQTWAEISVSG